MPDPRVLSPARASQSGKKRRRNEDDIEKEQPARRDEPAGPGPSASAAAAAASPKPGAAAHAAKQQSGSKSANGATQKKRQQKGKLQAPKQEFVNFRHFRLAKKQSFIDDAKKLPELLAALKRRAFCQILPPPLTGFHNFRCLSDTSRATPRCRHNVLAVDCEGVRLSRTGALTLIQVRGGNLFL